MPVPQPPAPAPSDAEVARYAAELLAELRRLALNRPALKTMHYLLGMAALEADRVKVGEPKG